MVLDPPNADVTINTTSLQGCGSEGRPSTAAAQSQENVETELGGINIPSRKKKIEVKKGRVGGCAHHQGGATQSGASRSM